MSTATAIDLQARLWRNGSDGKPQLTVTLPDGSKLWVRIPKSSTEAYQQACEVLDAKARAGAADGPGAS